jgi:anti-sigma regulatory factor (Ser/Thr protein kinase)
MEENSNKWVNQFQKSYRGTSSNVRFAREDLKTWLHERNASSVKVVDLTLIVSELASNAVQAAPEQDFWVKALDQKNTIQLEAPTRYLISGVVVLGLSNL